MTNHGVVPVEVKPIAVPQPSGEVKLGAGAAAYRLRDSWGQSRLHAPLEPFLSSASGRSAPTSGAARLPSRDQNGDRPWGVGWLLLDRVDALPSCFRTDPFELAG